MHSTAVLLQSTPRPPCAPDGGTNPLLPQTPYYYGVIVNDGVTRFCRSRDATMSLKHVWIPKTMPMTSKDGSGRRQEMERPTEQWVLDRMMKVWERMNPSSGKNFAESEMITLGYEHVLKVYQLSGPDLSYFDCIMLDEAQDIDPCQADIIASQRKCRIIVVGDPHQVMFLHCLPPKSIVMPMGGALGVPCYSFATFRR